MCLNITYDPEQQCNKMIIIVQLLCPLAYYCKFKYGTNNGYFKQEMLFPSTLNKHFWKCRTKRKLSCSAKVLGQYPNKTCTRLLLGQALIQVNSLGHCPTLIVTSSKVVQFWASNIRNLGVFFSPNFVV
jgi:hypothetical protein